MFFYKKSVIKVESFIKTLINFFLEVIMLFCSLRTRQIQNKAGLVISRKLIDFLRKLTNYFIGY